MSKLVPPMSTEMELASPAWLAMATLPMTPAAGPDSMVCTGFSTASPAVIVPPLDCIMCTSEGMPRSAMLACRRLR